MPDALIRFYNGNYFATIKASSSLASNPVFTLPINDGNNGEFFKTDGNGVTSWATPVSASTSTAGIVELAIDTEVTAGTSATLAVTPDALAGSVAFGTRYIQCIVVGFETDIEEGTGKFYLHIPPGLDGMELIASECHLRVITAGSGSIVGVQFFLMHDPTSTSAGNNMLTTNLTIDNGEVDSSQDTAAVVNATYKEVNTNDMIRIDVIDNGGDSTIAKGLIVTLGFRLP